MNIRVTTAVPDQKTSWPRKRQDVAMALAASVHAIRPLPMTRRAHDGAPLIAELKRPLALARPAGTAEPKLFDDSVDALTAGHARSLVSPRISQERLSHG